MRIINGQEFPDGFLSSANIDHQGSHFRYIVMLHETIWRLLGPGASGDLWDVVEARLQADAEARKEPR